MKKTFLILLSAVCIASASQSGAEIFNKCGICHGDKGQKHSQNITNFIAGMEKDSLVNILKEYKAKTRNKYGLGTIMQGQTANLSDEDIDSVATHISSLEPVREEDVKKVPTSNVSLDGATIFNKCAICHGDKGHKRSLNVSKLIAGMDKAHIYKTLKAYQEGTLSSYGYGSMMQGQATKLSDKEMKMVAKYVSTLPAIDTEKNKKDNTTQEVKRISKTELDRNTFIRNFFAKSKNPNETLKAAQAAYKKYKNELKENND
jgi:cytochrome c553